MYKLDVDLSLQSLQVTEEANSFIEETSKCVFPLVEFDYRVISIRTHIKIVYIYVCR